MESKTNNERNQKVTERLSKLYNATNRLSQKDITVQSYVTEKCARISSVTYMLANILNDEVELKDELKKSSIGLVRDSALSTTSYRDREHVIGHLTRIVALLEFAKRSGALSKMNTDVLVDDILSFLEVLGVADWVTGRRYVSSSNFRDDVPGDMFSPEPIIKTSSSYEGRAKDVFVNRGVQRHTNNDDTYNRQEEKKEVRPVPHYKERLQEVQKDRRATILGLVQRKDRINVKDVSNVIKDCSEKTIQRELLALVRQGVLKKEGERRWSTYTLA